MAEPTIKDQLELEKRMVAFGVTRHRIGVEKATEKGRGGDVQYAQKLMQEFVKPVSDAIREFVNEKKPGVRSKFKGMMKVVDPEVAAYLGLRALFDHFTHNKPLAALGQHIGMLIEDEAKFTKFQEKHGEYYNTIIEDFKRKGTVNYRHMHRVLTMKAKQHDVKWVDWLPSERLNVGVKLLDIIMQSTTLIEKKTERTQGKKKAPQTIIVPSQECLDWVNKFEHYIELLNPDRTPTIIPPDDWTAIDQGGYYSPQLRRRTPLVKLKQKSHLKHFETDLTRIMDAVNALQRTAWKVNEPVLAVLKEAWNNSLPVGLPQSEPYPMPESPVPKNMKKVEMSVEQREQFEEWKAEARIVHTMNKERVSKCFQVIRVMRMATEYAQYDKFWYVYQCDFRGRIYASVSGMSPQGPDFAKSLLQFAEGKALGERGVYWLKVHGANTYGIDKLSYDDRIKWVHSNERAILSVANDPLSHRDFWGIADKPWQFLAFCFEYARLKQEGPDMLSYLPIALDGSCNGLQNFSAMLRDEVGGRATNLTPSKLPADIYSEVAAVCTKKVMAVEDDEQAAIWQGFIKSQGGTIPRGLTKRPVMTLPYGSTQQSCREYIYKYMIEDAGDYFSKEQRFKLSVWLTPYVWESIGEVVIAAREAMDWIQESASMLAKAGHPTKWHTPLGFPVFQDRRKVLSKKIETQLAGRIQIRMNEDSPKIDVQKQRLGASPNFVHSMDACHLMMTLHEATGLGIESFACIHDDYGTHACHTDSLHKAIRKAFVDLYSQNDPLEMFQKEQESAYGIVLPDRPKQGKLKLPVILDSPYFFG